MSISQATWALSKGLHSLSLFGLCIDKLEEIVNTIVKEEGLDGPNLVQDLIFILPYVNDVVLF